jgi:hypothetical protein
LYLLNNSLDKIPDVGAIRKPRTDRAIEDVLKDLNPEIRDLVKKIMKTNNDKYVKEKLERLIGLENTRKIIEEK